MQEYTGNYEGGTNDFGSSDIGGGTAATGKTESNGGLATRDQIKDQVNRRAEDVNRRISEGVDRSRLAASERLKTTSKTLEDFGERLTGGIERAGESARQGLTVTSRRVGDFATYLEERDSQQMWEDSKEVVRRHPGKSLIAGLCVGLLVGRILR